jgi:hypothetical protein
MENKFESYLEAASSEKAGETKLTDKELMAEAISAMRKLKKFKDVKEAREALNTDFSKLAFKLQEIEDTIADMIHEVASMITWDGKGDGEIDDEDMDAAFDRAHDMFAPLMKGVTSIDFKRVKEKILATVKKNIDSRHEAESNSASEKVKAEAPANAE